MLWPGVRCMSKHVEVLIVVEGPTEEMFVREVLAPELAKKYIYLRPVLIGKLGHQGGNVRFDRAKGDIGNYLKRNSDIYVSTMFDYFRIDSAWPGGEEVGHRLRSGARLLFSQIKLGLNRIE